MERRRKERKNERAKLLSLPGKVGAWWDGVECVINLSSHPHAICGIVSRGGKRRNLDLEYC